jgi:membrane-bound ClpP family serine protease
MSGVLAIVGLILFVIGLIWKLALGIPLGIWEGPPANLVVEWWTITVIHIGGLVLFVISIIYYLLKGRKTG